MAKYKIWNKQEDIFTPIGERLTPEEWLGRYNWAAIPNVKMIIGGGAINGTVALEFEATKEFYENNYGETWKGCETDQDILDRMEYWDNYIPEGTGESTAEERIAAALEYLSALSSPVINEDDPDVD